MDEMNRAIPVMLEIVAMSSRAGMSLDQALSIYCEAFGGPLSRRMRRCMAEYLHGVRDRDQAMRIMADELDLPAFRHFTETAVESLRFGVPMTDALEELARQVRDEEKAAISARIAKAPVKMLLPMGLFMLPAMLLLTLGPVVMNMMAGMA
jgi:tight adherence protein C